MVNNIGPVDLLQAALKGASLKQSVIANNIANADTPGYHRADVKFEATLAKAIESGSTEDLSNLNPEIIRPGDLPADSNDNDVNMDMEVGELIKNSGQYKTCMRLLSSMYKQMQTAISDQI
jgi:flagellar basal-body rod protein FlgB